MSIGDKLVSRLAALLQWRSAEHFEAVKLRNTPRTWAAFVEPYQGDEVAARVAKAVWDELVGLVPADCHEFTPNLADRLVEDYRILEDEIEEVLVDLSRDVLLPLQPVHCPPIITVKDLVDFVVELVHKYPPIQRPRQS